MIADVPNDPEASDGRWKLKMTSGRGGVDIKGVIWSSVGNVADA